MGLDPRRVALVLNPAARRAVQALIQVESACAAAGLDAPLVLRTSVGDPGAGQARAAVEAGCGRVVVAGGDGTVRLVAGAVAQTAPPHARGTSAGVSLGIVAAGTANLTARGLGLPLRSVRRAAQVAVGAPARPVDLGTAELSRDTGETSREPFLVLVGVGHDAQILAGLRAGAKARVGWPAYVAPGLLRLHRSDRPVTVRVDDNHLPVPGTGVGPGDPPDLVWSVLVVNAAQLPLGARVVPAARADDGLLHVALVAPRSLLEWGRIARTGWGGRHTDGAALRYAEGRSVQLTMPAAPVQVDGDVLPDIVGARIEIRPGALRVAGALPATDRPSEGA